MRPTQLLILGTALTAGIGAAVMVATSKPTEVRMRSVMPTKVATDDVLVATKPLVLGAVIENGDLRWQSWPKANIPPNVIRESTTPRALAEFKGALVRNPFGPGEPVYPGRLVKVGDSGFVAAILPSGMRAVAINIDQQGSTSAGGFIHSNDHVDVIHTYRDEEAAKAGVDPMVSETLLRNVKVLAIGQNIQEHDKERAVMGSNATLELTPHQAETIILAQRVGQLSLILRSMADNKVSATDPIQKPSAMTIVRYGVPIQTRSR